MGLDGLDEIVRANGLDEADGLLAALAETVAGRLGATDLAGRWEPDELALLLPRAQEEEVLAVASAMVTLVTQAATPRVPAGSVAASVGVAVVTSPDDPLRLAGRASRAMAAAHARGGGGWVMAGLEATA